jgi:hypothetical protein
MPWKSTAQAAWGNSPAGHEALGDKGVAEWNAASKGKKLPKRVAMYHGGDVSSFAGSSAGGAHSHAGSGTMIKGHRPHDAHYAQGGAVLGRTTDFMKTPNEFTTGKGVPQDYSAKGSPAKRTGDKSLKAVKPRT